MTNTELISTWIEQPLLIKKENHVLIQNLSAEFPYFFPLYYLNAICNFDYSEAPIKKLVELFPANRVLLYQLFQKKPLSIVNEKVEYIPSEEAPTEAQEIQNFQPFFPDEVLKFNIAPNDYFAGQGIAVSSEYTPSPNEEQNIPELSKERDLMVVMSFSEWLRYLEERSRKAKEEQTDKSALRALWQKQKLTAAIEEEEEEIPENVFEMAVNSITAKEEIVSESMAAVYALQGKKEKAWDMYKKLSLQNPEKSTYFAKKIEDLKKDMDI